MAAFLASSRAAFHVGMRRSSGKAMLAPQGQCWSALSFPSTTIRSMSVCLTSPVWADAGDAEDARAKRRAARAARRQRKAGGAPQTESVVKATASEEKKSSKPASKAAAGAIEKVKELWRKYGMVALGFYGTLWVVPAGSAFVALSTFDNFGVDPNALLEWAGFEWRPTGLKPWHTTAVMSFVIADVLEPVRLMITMAATPALARKLGKAPPKEEETAKADK